MSKLLSQPLLPAPCSQHLLANKCRVFLNHVCFPVYAALASRGKMGALSLMSRCRLQHCSMLTCSIFPCELYSVPAQPTAQYCPCLFRFTLGAWKCSGALAARMSSSYGGRAPSCGEPCRRAVQPVQYQKRRLEERWVQVV